MPFVQYARLALLGAFASIATSASPAFAASASLATAQTTCPAGSLGVERVLEVDTTGGPWFGSPHGDPNFLRPGEVVLTFDDGPSPKDTGAILAALAKECTKATFFVVGSMVALHPEMVAEIAKQGHTIGTHTWSHANLAALPIAQATQQIESAIDAAQKASPTPIAPFFRYPYLASNKQTVDYLRSRNIGQFAIDVDSLDWRIHNPKAMVKKVMAGLKKRGRGIILMHDIHKSTADALPELLAEIKAAGYKVVQLKPKEPVQVIAGISPPAAPVHVRSHRRTFKRHHTASQTKKITPAQVTFKTFLN
jgi:peptidoglycan/xylan/chitin deacetylase (PgdA/CDA1 family)